jgi:hypothetical protein
MAAQARELRDDDKRELQEARVSLVLHTHNKHKQMKNKKRLTAHTALAICIYHHFIMALLLLLLSWISYDDT